MRRFETETGSVYEIEGNKIRRESGRGEPTECLRPAGEWKTYVALIENREGSGSSLFIQWPPDAPHSFTTTSRGVWC